MEIKPYQIAELIGQYGDISLSSLITEVLTGKTFDCPECQTIGTIPDPKDPTKTIECPTCDGYGKTDVEYEAYPIETGYRVKPPQLADPTGLVLTPGSALCGADCDDVVNATSYQFQISPVSNFASIVQDKTVSVSESSFGDLLDGQEYFVRVRALADGYSPSDWCDPVSATTT